MFCTNCGKEIKDGSTFCTNCGKKLTAAKKQADGAQKTENPCPPEDLAAHTAPVTAPHRLSGGKVAAIVIATAIVVGCAVGGAMHLMHSRSEYERELQAAQQELLEVQQAAEQAQKDAEETQEQAQKDASAAPAAEANTSEPPQSRINLIDTISSEEQKRINVFLSNFSEVFFAQEPYTGADAGQMIDFAFLHNKVNNPDTVRYDAETMCISAETIARSVKKFFNYELDHQSTPYYIYYDNWYYAPAATGENYSYCSIARRMYDNWDGTYEVDFSVFAGPVDAAMSPYYAYSPAQADRDSSLTLEYTGTAIVAEREFEGRPQYYLISYQRD